MRKQEGSTTIVFGTVNGVTKTTKPTSNWTGMIQNSRLLPPSRSFTTIYLQRNGHQLLFWSEYYSSLSHRRSLTATLLFYRQTTCFTMITTIFVGCRVLASNYVVCIWLITPFRHMIYLKSGGNMDPDSVSRHHHLLKRGGFKGNADAKGVFWRWQHAYITERCCSCQADRKDLFFSVLKFQTKLIVEVSTEVYRRARN